MAYEELLAEWYEAKMALIKAEAEARADPELATLPEDVRGARVVLRTLAEAERFNQAMRRVEQVKADREERWLAAHEVLAPNPRWVEQ